MVTSSSLSICLNIFIVFFFQDDDDNLKKFKSLIWGPTCDALDKVYDLQSTIINEFIDMIFIFHVSKIIEETYLPNLSCGDLVAFPNMGAYTVPIASPFNGFLVPKTLYFKSV